MAIESAGARGLVNGAGQDPGQVLRERLGRAGFATPRAETVVIDLAGDPPLGRSAIAIAVEEAERVVAGAGAALVVARAGRAIVAVRTVAAERAVRDACERLGGTEGRSAIEVIRMPPLWPSLGLAWDLGLDPAWTWVLDGEALLDLESAALGPGTRPAAGDGGRGGAEAGGGGVARDGSDAVRDCGDFGGFGGRADRGDAGGGDGGERWRDGAGLGRARWRDSWGPAGGALGSGAVFAAPRAAGGASAGGTGAYLGGGLAAPCGLGLRGVPRVFGCLSGGARRWAARAA